MEEEREPLTQTEASSTSDSPTKGTLVLTDSAETSLERKDLIQDLSYSSFSFILHFPASWERVQEEELDSRVK